MYEHMPDVLLPRPDQGIHVEDHTFFISADLGQANDYTAISILERIVKGYGILGLDRMGERAYHLRHVERMRQVEYPLVCARLAALYNSPELADVEKSVVIDFTGLGRPFYDLMKASGFYYSLNAISITGGMDVTMGQGQGVYHVPKRDLVSTLQVLLQNGTLKIASAIMEKSALIEELSNFAVKISASGHDTYGGRSGVHDDIVLSVSMAAWLATRRWCRWSQGKVM